MDCTKASIEALREAWMGSRTDPGVLTQIPWVGLGTTNGTGGQASRSSPPAVGKEMGKMREQ